jgi:phage tail-like protein
MGNEATNLLYLNRENAWLGFQMVGLDLTPAGALQLATIPRLAAPLPIELEGVAGVTQPAGLAVDECGDVYYSLPGAGSLGVIGLCEDGANPASCLPGEGDLPGQLREPRGLLYHPVRKSLLVADSGNSRIQAFDPQTWQVTDVWGRAGFPGAPPWGLHSPIALAAGPDGSVYVVEVETPANEGDEAGQQLEYRVLKFDRFGRPRHSFWRRAVETGGLQRPVGVATATVQGEDYVFVLDAALLEVVVLDTHGRQIASIALQPPARDEDDDGEIIVPRPLGIAATGDSVFVGENARREVLVFKRVTRHASGATQDGLEYEPAGVAFGYRGPVAALAVGTSGEMWLHPGDGGNPGTVPLRLEITGAHARSGVSWGGPFGTDLRRVRWHRLQATLGGLTGDAHARFFCHITEDRERAPAAPDPTADLPFSAPDWQPLPLDVADGLLPRPCDCDVEQAHALNKPPRPIYLWVGVHLSGGGLSSPALEQVMVSYDQSTYRQYLPAIFGRDPEQAYLLDRLLSLFESFFGEAERQIEDLKRLFDPQATPPAWLPWLASWLALDLPDTWPDARKRDAIRSALESYGRRGTVVGLRQALRDFAGVDARIEEPLASADWWALPGPDRSATDGSQSALLGFTTRLALSRAGGAILGNTATLDASTLTAAEDYGVPLFENLAHRFVVQVYRGQVGRDGGLERVRRVLEQESPAHTAYDLRVIEPQMRVGFQARLGIDSVVAGPLSPTPLSESGGDVILGGEPAGQIGGRAQIGQSTRLITGSAG